MRRSIHETSKDSFEKCARSNNTLACAFVYPLPINGIVVAISVMN
jgi:hypothetical protein